ncbi:MAG TPA: hypothetical protein PK295_01865 [Candidatus Magasanikbacteria bacterium]|nr:hypothetical protein [Candidatus Magasanikbacteria bacterium]
MKEFKLNERFYFLFLLLSLPIANWLTEKTQKFIEWLLYSFLNQLSQWGVIEPLTPVAIIIILFWIVERYLWKLFVFTGIVPPNLNGRYEGKLTSSYDRSKTYPFVIEVCQTLLTTKVYLYTATSPSYSFLATVGKNEKENWTLYYLYQNDVRNLSPSNSDMKRHQGTAILEIFTKKPIELQGAYYNDGHQRGTHGDISCKLVSKKRIGRFTPQG